MNNSHKISENKRNCNGVRGISAPPYGILHTPARQIPIIHRGHLRYAITRMRRLQQLGQDAWIQTPRGTIR